MRILAASFLAGLSCAAYAQTGTIYARSTPPGATIYIDSAQASSSTTPTVIRNLSPGKHRLRFVFPGGKEVVREVTVEANKLASISVSLSDSKPAAVPAASGGGATVKVVSDPAGAELIVDGKVVGRTPCSARDLAAGTHSFLLKKAGHANYDTSLQLKPGETRLLQAKLESASSSARPAPKTSGVPRKTEKKCPLCQGTAQVQTMGCITCKRVGYTKDLGRCVKCGGSGTLSATCPRCRGNGVVRGKACSMCGGSGKPKCPLCKGTGKVQAENPDYYKDKYDIITCRRCAGSGLNESFPCQFCKGEGRKRMTYRSGGVWWRRTIECWFCKGQCDGSPPCAACRGAGVVGNELQSAACPKCGGTGKIRAPCPSCRGKGWLKKYKQR